MKMVEIVKDELEGFRGYAILFKVPKKIRFEKLGIETEYFVVSCINNSFLGVNEIMVFPADENGNIISWVEVMDGRDIGIYDAIEMFEHEYLG